MKDLINSFCLKGKDTHCGSWAESQQPVTISCYLMRWMVALSALWLMEKTEKLFPIFLDLKST